MKVIFLDIDGVLNNHASLAEGIQLVNEKCKLLKRIINETNAVIVISSTWRLGRTVESLNDMIWTTGGPYRAIIGATAQLSGPRGNEIKDWFIGHAERKGAEVTQYIIIDDDSDMLEEQMPYFIKTDMRTGLTTKCALQAIDILNGKGADVVHIDVG